MAGLVEVALKLLVRKICSKEYSREGLEGEGGIADWLHQISAHLTGQLDSSNLSEFSRSKRGFH